MPKATAKRRTDGAGNLTEHAEPSKDAARWAEKQETASDDEVLHQEGMGEEILAEAIKEPTLDRMLDGNPKVLFPDLEAYKPLVNRLRFERTQFIAKEAKRKAKKEGVDTDDE